MNHVDVDSSALASIAYEDGTLEVRFNSGAVHRYEDVPAHVHAALMSADSKGSHYHKHVRGHFKSTKVSPAKAAP